MMPKSVEHNLGLLEKIVNAVLYEGYMLYPYRSSSVKNRQRWNFGVLFPRSYSESSGGTDAWSMQTECLVRGDQRAALDVKVRFLHLLEREVGVPVADYELGTADCGDSETLSAIFDSHFQVVESLEIDGRLFQTWQEASERDVSLPDVNLSELVAQPKHLAFTFPASREIELLSDTSGHVAGLIARKQGFIEGQVELTAAQVESDLYKLTVRVLNLTPLDEGSREPRAASRNWQGRDDALMRSLVSTHTVLGMRGGGEFVSLLDPPEDCREHAAACANVGTWPVLVGEEGDCGLMLSSPIILYDYPQVAPESAGDLFDGTEIDEILTLRIMTLTDDEKREMRGVDERARRLLERTETMPAEQLMKLHGAMKKK